MVDEPQSENAGRLLHEELVPPPKPEYAGDTREASMA
jgi:hypothetical protein